MGASSGQRRAASTASRWAGWRLPLFCVWILLLPTQVAAQSLLPPLVRLSTGDDYPPFSAKAEPDGGAAVALVRAVFAELTQPIALEIEPWNRGQERVQSHQIDATFPYVPTPERMALYRYSRPLATIHIRLYTRAGLPLAELPFAEIAAQTLCIARGTTPSLPSRALLDHGRATLVNASDVASCFKLLMAKRVDLVQTHEHLAVRAMRQLDLSPLAIQPVGRDDPASFEEVGLHLIVSRSLPHGEALIAAFDQGLGALRQNGRFAEILARYGLTLPSS